MKPFEAEEKDRQHHMNDPIMDAYKELFKSLAIQLGAGVAVLIFLAASYLVGTAVATQATIKEAQRSAVIAGAARWSSNRETGEAEFNYVTCLKPEVK